MSFDFKYHRCRTCNHTQTSHYKGGGSCRFGLGDGPAWECINCFEYVPLDNLEYLEWKYDQQFHNR